jgi:hypothetical protein
MSPGEGSFLSSEEEARKTSDALLEKTYMMRDTHT